MYRIILIFIFLSTISGYDNVFCNLSDSMPSSHSGLSEIDTLFKYQDLYHGRIWTNKYRRINGDQYLFANYFLSGTVSAKGKTYKNLKVRYDVLNDEIMIPVNREEIILLNKEMVDSFTLTFENKSYNFIKIGNDTLNGNEGFKGFVRVLYKEKSILYIKYIKEISPHVTDKSDGDFITTDKIYLLKDGVVMKLSSENDFFKSLSPDITMVKNYIRNNKLKVSKTRPESFIPLLKHFDSMSK